MAFQQRSDLNKEAQSFGREAGEAYKVDVLKTKSDYTRDQLIADARNNQKRELKEAEERAKAEEKSSSSSAKDASSFEEKLF